MNKERICSIIPQTDNLFNKIILYLYHPIEDIKICATDIIIKMLERFGKARIIEETKELRRRRKISALEHGLIE